LKIDVAVIGAGPAGLMAAETLAGAGAKVTVYDRMPSPGRKFLMAGRGGLNLTHSEPLDRFMTRYGPASPFLEPSIQAFTPANFRQWCEGLGQPVFVGSSGRVFPKSFKASPLLRAWLSRLESLGVSLALRHHWTGWDEAGNLVFSRPDRHESHVEADATLLALGGASWPKLGSDGGWVDILKNHGIPVSPLRPANCGFTVAWSDIFRQRFSGQPLKPVTLTFAGATLPGEVMIDEKGVEGGLIYAFSRSIRDEIDRSAQATILLDLRPGLSLSDLSARLDKPRGRDSFSNYLRKTTGLPPVAIGLVHESGGSDLAGPQLALRIKSLPVCVTSPFPIAGAISSAGGVPFAALDEYLMLSGKPGVFAAGEMLDWEAPTGGYLLQASFSTAIRAAQGILRYSRN
jgi:uncharacterized flavoprotein (TIGR03862 family)